MRTACALSVSHNFPSKKADGEKNLKNLRKREKEKNIAYSAREKRRTGGSKCENNPLQETELCDIRPAGAFSQKEKTEKPSFENVAPYGPQPYL